MAEDRARARRWRGLSFRAVGSSAVNLPLGGLGLLSDEGHSPYSCVGLAVEYKSWPGWVAAQSWVHTQHLTHGSCCHA